MAHSIDGCVQQNQNDEDGSFGASNVLTATVSRSSVGDAPLVTLLTAASKSPVHCGFKKSCTLTGSPTGPFARNELERSFVATNDTIFARLYNVPPGRKAA